MNCLENFQIDLKSLKEGLQTLEYDLDDSFFNAIEGSKSQSLDKLLFALGIRHVGAKVARTLALKYGTMDKLKKQYIG